MAQQRLDAANGPVLFADGELVESKYQIISKIGAGGMGSVYRVKQIFLNKIFALKTLDRAASEVSHQRFQLEAKAASSLAHPSLVQVHDFGLHNGEQPYLVMDFISGITFAEYLKRHGPIQLKNVPALFAPVCFGLLTAHEHGVIHRDIKPANLMIVDGIELGASGSIKIVDFGIAKLTNTEEGEIQALTRTGEVFGSPVYMSPEQCTGGTVDNRSDIYSLGCVLFEMLAGTPPHLGKNALATMMLHESGKIPTLKEASLGMEFPPALEQIVFKMLQREPAYRYQNIGEVAHDLATACKSDDGAAVPRLSERPATKDSRAARRIIFGAAIATAVAALLGAAFFLFGNRISAPTPLDKTGDVNPANSNCDIKTNSDTEVNDGSNPNSNSNSNATGIVAAKENEGNEIDYSKWSFSLKDEDDRNMAKAKAEFVAINSISSSTVTTDGVPARQFIFPECGMGDLCQFNHFDVTHVLVPARGVCSTPVDERLVLNIGGHRVGNRAALDSPSLFSKIGKNEFVGLVLSQDTDPSNKSQIAKIMQFVAKWTKLELLSLRNVRDCDATLQATNDCKSLRDLELMNCECVSPESVDQPFLSRLNRLYLAKLEPAVVQKIFRRLEGSTDLKWLCLDSLIVSADELAELEDCPNLVYVQVNNIDVSIVETLSRLHALKCVFLKGPKATVAQIKTLGKSKRLEKIVLSQDAYFLSEQESLKCADPRVTFNVHH